MKIVKQEILNLNDNDVIVLKFKFGNEPTKKKYEMMQKYIEDLENKTGHKAFALDVASADIEIIPVSELEKDDKISIVIKDDRLKEERFAKNKKYLQNITGKDVIINK